MSEFHSLGFYGDSVPDPGPRPSPKPREGRRKLFVSQAVALASIRRSEDHQVVMGDFAARAVRWFAEQPLEIEWHTLEFKVSEVDEFSGRQQWAWTVWAH